MEEMSSLSWQRSGCSLVWSPDLLGSLITAADAIPLRTLLGWQAYGFPEDPPDGRSAVLVGGLQTVLELLPQPDAAHAWLRGFILPACRSFYQRWPFTALVFGLDGPGRLFNFHEADELVYFGRSADRNDRIKLTWAIWNGAATGPGTYQLVVPETKEVGGYHVRRVS
jgi:hypothetical protein